MVTFLRQARFLLSPDPEFSQVGTKTHVDYLKAFKQYRDMIREEAHTPTYRAILSSFSRSVFEKVYDPTQLNTVVCGGDGESEDEMMEYRRRLEQAPEEPLQDSINTDTDPLPLPGAHHTSTPTPVELESEAEEELPVAPGPKKRPAPTKKVDSPANPSNAVLESPVPGSSTPEDPAPGGPVGSKKKATRGKKAAPVEQPTGRTLRNRVK
jgi:hypothetical protein